MYTRLSLAVLTVLMLGLFNLSSPRAASQLVDKRQALIIGYPNLGIVVSDKVPVYKGVIYVKVYSITPGAATSSSSEPVVTATLTPSQRSVSQLPLGEYEVHYAIRNGSELTTLIHRNVVLRADQPANMLVEINADAKTTIIGGDWTAQRMKETILRLEAEVNALKKEVAELKQKE